MRVLLAEADRDRRNRLRGWLEKWGHPVVPTDTVPQTCSTLRSDEIQLVLLDRHLPDLRVERMVELIAEQDLPQRPALILMALPSDLPSVKGIDGLDDVVLQPVQPMLLRLRLESVSRLMDARDHLSEINRTAPMAILVLDELRQVVDMNAAAAVLTGHSPPADSLHHYATVLGCIHALADADGCGKGPVCQGCQLRRLMQELRDGVSDLWRRHVVIYRRAGSRSIELHLLVTAGLTRAAGRPRTLLFLEDLTEQKRIESSLRSTMAELEAFNRVAIGRELRMIELKRQVNDLAQRLGEPPPYDLRFAENNAEALALLSAGEEESEAESRHYRDALE